MAALRDYTLCGGRNSAWLRPNQAAKQLGDRADFRDLLDRAGALVAAEATAKNAQSTPEEKLAARQEVLANLEALAGPSPTARFALRALAQARQDLGRAYLDLGNVDEARAAFDEALAIRQRLVEENPKSEALRADLTRSQVAAGDLLAAAGRLREAERAWEQGLAVLEYAGKANPNSLVIRSTLSEESVHVGRKYGDHGLVAEGARHYRRAFELLTPTSYGDWYRYATLLAEGGDVRRLRELTDRMAARPEPNEEVDAGYRARVLLLDPAGADRHPEAVRRIAENFRYREDGWEPWVRGFAHVRLGQAEKGLPLLETATDPDRKWSAVALAFHQLGRADEAREALRQADLAADRRMRIGLSDETLRLPDKWWEDRLLFRSLRREAHRAIRGRPLPDSPYDRLHRARVLLALDRPGEAEAEFAAAVEIRPDDPEVWLARAGVFARLGRKDRAVADLGRALQLPGADPRPWIDAGRALAEAGEPEKADAAYARAAALAAGGLTPFLEAGWWVAGPYPPTLDLPCPPEMSADPSEPVAAVGRPDDLRWKAVPAPPHSGDIEMGPVAAGTKNGSFYALAHVYSERDRTADLYFRPGTDARLWVNGRLVFGGLAGWRIKPATPVRIPVTLRAGRNTLLAKNLYRDGKGWCECRFTDSPYPRGWDLVELGLWAEGSDAFAEADRSAPLTPWVTRMRILFLLAAGRDEEARRVYAEMVRRYDRSGDDTFPVELAVACPLPPERSAERDRLVRRQEAQAGEQPNSAPQQFWLGYVCYRAARFEEAEKALRRAIELRDDLYCVPLLASTCHHLGRAEEAQRLLRQAEERYAEAVTASLKAPSHRLPLGSWENDPVFLFTLREARALINGREPGPDPNEPALRARALERLAELGAAEDDYAKLVLMSPGQPRLWIDRGRRLGELGRWGEAAKAFARAVKIAPKLPQVWKERGRAYAELGRWDEAAADFARALDLAPRPKTVFPYYPWKKGRGEIEDLVARWDEVFDRVVKLRPDDAALWARRVEHFAAQGRWAETEAALRVVVERFPDDWWAPNLLAKLLLHGGDVEGYRQVCREALERFAGTQDPWAAVNLVRTAALAPAGPHELPQFGDLFRTMTERPPNHFWFHATPALADYRRGDAAGAVKRLSARAMGQIALREAEPAFVDAVRALACQRAGRPAEARDALGRARAALDRQRPRPERGWAYDFDWHNWLQAELLVREAEALIPGAPAVAAEALPPAQEEAARRERKQR
ncbi:MAG TPA: tetratricopeptide repeat protein, partial [Gemmataceae bacterium]